MSRGRREASESANPALAMLSLGSVLPSISSVSHQSLEVLSVHFKGWRLDSAVATGKRLREYRLPPTVDYSFLTSQCLWPIQPFIRTFIHLFVCIPHSFTYAFIHTFSCVFLHTFIHIFTHAIQVILCIRSQSPSLAPVPLSAMHLCALMTANQQAHSLFLDSAISGFAFFFFFFFE